MAFTFEGLRDDQMKNDPQFTKIHVRLRNKVNGERNLKFLDHHKCTDEDFKEFYPLSAKHEIQFNEIINDEKRGFLCLDWTDDMFIYGGSEGTIDFQKLEILLFPCNSHNTGFNATTAIADKCIDDQ